MARNKYPEETLNLILNTAQKLFIENGYDNTSVQSIINNLGGLSKGAIYHHFKSKEEILESIMQRWDEEIIRDLRKVLSEARLNGAEKLHELLKRSLFSIEKDITYYTAPDLRKNPQMLVKQLESAMDEVVPGYILPILEEGIADGSIQTEYPRELAEVIALLCNIWLNPMVFYGTNLEDMLRRVEFFDQLCRKFGLELIDEEMMQQFRRVGKDFYKRNNQGKTMKQ